MKTCVIYIMFFVLPVIGIAQSKEDFDEFRKNLLKDYSSFHQETMNNYKSFRDSINHEYAKALGKPWKNGELIEGNPIPEKNVKPVPPVIRDKEKENILIPIEQTPVVVIPEPVIEEQPQPYVPIENDLTPIQSVPLTVTFYGRGMSINMPQGFDVKLAGIDNRSISESWMQLSEDVPEKMLEECLHFRQKYQLCDWAYLNLLKTVSERICSGNTDKAVMLQAYLYCQSGYKMRLAHSSCHLYLLFASRHTIYNRAYYMIDGDLYYPQDCNEGQLAICQAAFPQEKPLSLLVQQEQLLGEKTSKSRVLSFNGQTSISTTVNEELIKFYDTYPTSSYNDDMMTRWAMYANTPLSKITSEKLYPQLEAAMKGLSVENSVQYLLSFVQHAFVYEYDEKVWGDDRAFFAEETLFYPYADCEDRSILFTRLVRDLLGLRCALVYSPGHLYTAVRLSTEMKGDALVIDGERFLICDPTYINADIGMIMPGMDKSAIKAIVCH